MIKKLKHKTYNLLRWSEKYTKTDMVYLAKGNFWLTMGQITSSIATFLLAIAFANLLPKETYGVYKYVLSVAGILAIATLRGMDTAINQAVARAYEGTVLPAVKIKIYWGILGTISSLGISLYYYVNNNTDLSISFLIISAFLPFIDTFSMYNNFLQGKKLFKLSTIYGIIIQLITTLLLLLTILITKNLFIIIFVYFSSWTLLRSLFFLKTIRKFPPNKNIDPKTLSYGKHSSIVNITATLIGSLDSVLVFHYLGAIALATYSFALAPVSQFRGLFDKLPILAIPKLANRDISDIEKILKERSIILFIIGIVLSFVYVIISPFVFHILFPKYMESVLLSQVFSISIAITLGNSFLSSVMVSKLTMIPKNFLYLWNIPGIILTLSILLLIKPFGIMGVIISRLLSLISSVIINLFIWKKIKFLENIKK